MNATENDPEHDGGDRPPLEPLDPRAHFTMHADGSVTQHHSILGNIRIYGAAAYRARREEAAAEEPYQAPHAGDQCQCGHVRFIHDTHDPTVCEAKRRRCEEFTLGTLWTDLNPKEPTTTMRTETAPLRIILSATVEVSAGQSSEAMTVLNQALSTLVATNGATYTSLSASIAPTHNDEETPGE